MVGWGVLMIMESLKEIDTSHLFHFVYTCLPTYLTDAVLFVTPTYKFGCLNEFAIR